jgi:hypothetical protein
MPAANPSRCALPLPREVNGMDSRLIGSKKGPAYERDASADVQPLIAQVRVLEPPQDVETAGFHIH